MNITNVHDVEKLLSTAEVSEQYIIEQSNVLASCKRGRLSEDEAVETSVGWLITPEGAARLWQPRETIEDTISKALQDKTWPVNDLEACIKETVTPLLGTERRRRCKITLMGPHKATITFKDMSLAIYDDSTDADKFHVTAVSPVKDTIIYSCPRGIETEIFRETYPTPYEAEQRIASFAGQQGWAKFPDPLRPLSPIGERVLPWGTSAN